MMQYLLPTIMPAIKDLVHHLVIGDYSGLEERGLIAPFWDGGLATDADEIARVIAGYGVTLIDLPDEAFDTAETDDGSGVSIKLWTAEEGRSGLTLDVHVVHIVGEDMPRVQIERLHGVPPKIIPALQEVIHRLVVGDYAGLEADGHLHLYKLTAADVEAMLTDYRDRAVTFAVEAGELPPMSPEDCVLVDMPVSALQEAEAFGGPDEWHVDVQLWWSNDCAGHDLALQAEVHSTGDGVDVQLMSLHVL